MTRPALSRPRGIPVGSVKNTCKSTATTSSLREFSQFISSDPNLDSEFLQSGFAGDLKGVAALPPRRPSQRHTQPQRIPTAAALTAATTSLQFLRKTFSAFFHRNERHSVVIQPSKPTVLTAKERYFGAHDRQRIAVDSFAGV